MPLKLDLATACWNISELVYWRHSWQNIIAWAHEDKHYKTYSNKHRCRWQSEPAESCLPAVGVLSILTVSSVLLRCPKRPQMTVKLLKVMVFPHHTPVLAGVEAIDVVPAIWLPSFRFQNRMGQQKHATDVRDVMVIVSRLQRLHRVQQLIYICSWYKLVKFRMVLKGLCSAYKYHVALGCSMTWCAAYCVYLERNFISCVRRQARLLQWTTYEAHFN